jgi:uncharacterized protein (UPF0332 family)
MGSKIEFEKCLKKGKLRVSADAKRLVKKEVKAAENDLREAEDGLKRNAFKWSTIQSYYAMFHTARALLYAKGYREKSHHCLRIGLEELYVAFGDLPRHVIDAFHVGKELRENADYESHFSEIGARKLVKAAQEFLEYANQLV